MSWRLIYSNTGFHVMRKQGNGKPHLQASFIAVYMKISINDAKTESAYTSPESGKFWRRSEHAVRQKPNLNSEIFQRWIVSCFHNNMSGCSKRDLTKSLPVKYSVELLCLILNIRYSHTQRNVEEHSWNSHIWWYIQIFGVVKNWLLIFFVARHTKMCTSVFFLFLPQANKKKKINSFLII